MKTEILVQGGQFVRRIVHEENIGSQTEILKKVQEQSYTILSDLFSVSLPTRESYRNLNRDETVEVPVHIGKNGGQCYAAHRMQYWPMKGKGYKRTVGGKDIFTFTGRDIEGKTMEERVVCLDYPGLWMIYNFSLNGHRVQAFNSIFVTTNIKGSHFAPHVPNIYNNGKMCTGEVRPSFEGDIQNFVQKTCDKIVDSKSNDHLMYRKGKELLHFNLTDKKWAPPKDFIANPAAWHSGRETTVASDMLTMIDEIEKKEMGISVEEAEIHQLTQTQTRIAGVTDRNGPGL